MMAQGTERGWRFVQDPGGGRKVHVFGGADGFAQVTAMTPAFNGAVPTGWVMRGYKSARAWRLDNSRPSFSGQYASAQEAEAAAEAWVRKQEAQRMKEGFQ